MPDICEVCEGSGEYPIHARGKHVYSITCPDCGGDGNDQTDAVADPFMTPVDDPRMQKAIGETAEIWEQSEPK